MLSWRLSDTEKEKGETLAKTLRFLWVYSAGNEWVIARHAHLLDTVRASGYCVTGICNTFKEDGYRWYSFPDLDRMWRRRHPLLMRLYEKIASAMDKHDVLILYNGANLHPEFIKQLSGIKAYTFGDPESWDNLAGPIGPAFDIHFANQPAMLDKFRANSMPNVFFYPLGSLVFPEHIHLTQNSLLDSTQRPIMVSLFCGRTSWRNDKLDMLATAFPKAYIKGNGWPAGLASYDEIHNTYLHSQIGWNIHNTCGFNFRTYELAAYGVMQLCDCRDDLPWVFDEKEIVGYDTVQDCIDKTHYYLAHQEEQRQIALSAWERWQREYTPLASWEYLASRIALFVAELTDNEKKHRKKRDTLQVDLAGKSHWDSNYAKAQQCSSNIANWEPTDYTGKVLAGILLNAVNIASPTTVLEIGCGNSVWMPWLACHSSIVVDGLDYSTQGCELAQKRLEQAGVSGTVYNADMFNPDSALLSHYDLVYSLGVAEHFADQENVIKTLMSFVKPGGYLLTEVPNIHRSLYGFLSRIWHPNVYYKHIPLSYKMLEKTYKHCGLNNVQGGYAGLCSLNIVGWGVDPRWPRIGKFFLPYISRLIAISDKLLNKIGIYKAPIKSLAPFIYIIGKKCE
jgi:2-polyprenyl-3-methyl-5-hydroxy-6-metoxy-1,4-benzoquinol methylase